MKTIISVIFTTIFFFLFSANSFAELKTFQMLFTFWINSNDKTSIAGVKIYCGKNHGGPYTGVDITGGNPLDIPVEDFNIDDPAVSMYVTMDTDTEKNAYCVITAYDANGIESDFSNEISFVPEIIEMDTNSNSLSIKDVRNLSTSENQYNKILRITRSYSFPESVIITSGNFKSVYREFVAIGQTSGKVWVLSRDSNGNFLPKEEWLSSVNMQNIDDIIALNFNKADEIEKGKHKDDIAVLDYKNGIVKVFINNGGTGFNTTPIPDGGFGTFSGNYAFQRSLKGDFTGNGYEDLALYAPTTRNVVVWESDGTTWRDRGVWCQGGSANAFPQAIDYNGDEKSDIMFFNFVGGAFSAFRSTGTSFEKEAVQYFTAGAFDYALVRDFDIFNGKKVEFGIHAKSSTGNFVVFKYAPSGADDTAPFKSERVWLNTAYSLY